MRPHGSAQQLEARRRKAVILRQQGHSRAQIARVLKTTTQAVGIWLRTHSRRGLAGLAAKPAAGRPPRLSVRQRRDLVKRLLAGAMASGFSTELWTGRRIGQMIHERYGVTYHVHYVPRLMAGLGFSPSEARASSPGAR